MRATDHEAPNEVYCTPLLPRPSSPNILFSTLFSNALSLRTSHDLRDQIHDHTKEQGKIIVLHILTCTFLDTRREEKFGTEK